MNARELFALAPFGAVVAFSDGTPRPPDRFNKKLRAWQSKNASGIFCQTYKAIGDRPWDKDSITLRTLISTVIVVNQSYSVDTALDFTIENQPFPRTIMAMKSWGEGRYYEMAHMWGSAEACHAWARHNGYQLEKQGWTFFCVDNTGTIIPAPEIVAATVFA